MFALIGIGLAIVVVVSLLRVPSGSSPQQPQVIYIQAVPQQQQDSGGAGALLLLIVAIIAAISFFPA